MKVLTVVSGVCCLSCLVLGQGTNELGNSPTNAGSPAVEPVAEAFPYALSRRTVSSWAISTTPENPARASLVTRESTRAIEMGSPAWTSMRLRVMSAAWSMSFPGG